MLLFNQIILSFLSLSLNMIVLLLVTIPTDPYIKKRPNFFLHIVFPYHNL